MKKIILLILAFLLTACQSNEITEEALLNTYEVIDSEIILTIDSSLDNAVDLPILMYHHIDESVNGNSAIVTPEKFKDDLEILKALGYETINFHELIAYEKSEGELPEKPIIITFDDGYLSNYTEAYPMLKEKEMKATVSVIGMSIGRDTYKETGHKIIPHFSIEQGKEMIASGFVDIQSHTFSMHDAPSLENGHYRDGANKKAYDTQESYQLAMTKDHQKMIEIINEKMLGDMLVLTYPYGYYDELSEAVLKSQGILATVSVDSGINTIQKGKGLYQLKRLNVTENTDLKAILESISIETVGLK